MTSAIPTSQQLQVISAEINGIEPIPTDDPVLQQEIRTQVRDAITSEVQKLTALRREDFSPTDCTTYATALNRLE